MKRFENIEEFSKIKAKELNMQFDEGIENEYFQHIYKLIMVATHDNIFER